MEVLTLTPRSPEWLAARRNFIGSSEISALLGYSSFTTPFELFHRKRGDLPENLVDNQRMQAGRHMEPAIIGLAAEQEGWQVEDPAGYYLHPRIKGMAASPDAIIRMAGREGPGIAEIKNVDYIQFRDKWTEGEPPVEYLLQLQHQLACTGYLWGAVVALVGGNDLKVFYYDRHLPVIAKIEGAVLQFWQDMEAGKAPDPFPADAGLMNELYPVLPTEIDLTADNELPGICAALLEAKARKSAAEKEEEGYKARILHAMQGHIIARAQGFIIKNQEVTVNHKAREASVSTHRRFNLKELNNV